MADENGWAPKDRDEYVSALKDALLGVEEHKWNTATQLHDDKAEKDAKNPPKSTDPDPKPKRRGIL